MRSAKIINGRPFDWGQGAEIMRHVANDDGSINWGAAFRADPGVTICPKCKAFYWAEGEKLECLDCGMKFSTHKEK